MVYNPGGSRYDDGDFPAADTTGEKMRCSRCGQEMTEDGGGILVCPNPNCSRKGPGFWEIVRFCVVIGAVLTILALGVIKILIIGHP